MQKVLTENPPYNAQVEATILESSDGWNMKSLPIRLSNILSISSKRFSENDVFYMGEGGSVPFVHIFIGLFPDADLISAGISGPNSNIHGLDENLDINFCQKLIMNLTYILSEY